MDTLALASLHKHFLAADAIKQLLFVDIPIATKDAGLRADLLEAGQYFSRVLRLQVFYGLLYVVVDGYSELGCQDRDVDELLTNADFVNALRRFRNATFHYQEDPFSEKLLDFIAAKGSDDWSRNVYHALDRFFTSQLRLEKNLDALASISLAPSHLRGNVK